MISLYLMVLVLIFASWYTIGFSTFVYVLYVISKMDASPCPRVIFAIDVEARGENMIRHGLLSIGFCVGRADRFEILEQGRFSMDPLPGQRYEQRCIDEFWKNYSDVKQTLEEEAKEASWAISDFRDKIAEWELKSEVALVSDFPGFDFALINYYMAHFGYPAIHFKMATSILGKSHVFRPTYDTDGYARGVMGYGYEYPWTSDEEVAAVLGFSVVGSKTHLPDEDAAHIYEMHIKTILAIQKLKSESAAKKRKTESSPESGSE
jgi:hypothetical protein